MDTTPPTRQSEGKLGRTILVVDDEAEIRTAVRQQLTRAGYDVREATTAKGALKEIRDGRISLVVTDIYMPDMDGMEFLTWMSREGPDIPVIAMSGDGDSNRPRLLEMATHLGAVHTLAKPFDPAELLTAVANAFK